MKLDNLFTELEEYNLGMGSLAISKNHQISYQNAFGYAQMSDSIQSAKETYYRIGSVTKIFTAVLIFQLIEEGQLNLDDRINTYFPEVLNAQLISVENLLNHSSGLSNYSDEPDFQKWKYEAKSRKELLDIVTNTRSTFEPGSQHEYSNSNFLLLSLILEKVSGKSYQRLLNDRILSQVGLTKTYYETAADTVSRKSRSYKYNNGSWDIQREDVAENHLGAGVIVSTPSDLLKFIDALFSFKLIEEESLKKMISTNQDYGSGVFKFQFESDIAYGHEGRINEYYTTLIHFPNSKLSIAYCTNGIGYPRNDIIKAVVHILSDQNYALPNFSGIRSSEEALTEFTGNYASGTMPIEVRCEIENGRLIVETQGSPFETIRISKNYFANYQFGYFFEFLPDKGALLIKETDNVYVLKK
ncbi:MAG: beta-lactamase family protein [Cytophagales bacterium]|nr:beta-lactamase family protein [Cytophagales bacterium]